MNNKNSNILIKTIIFALVVLLSCLLFFGLNDGLKTNMELIAFGFIMFSELIAYISILITSIIKMKKLESSDLISVGLLYFIASIITNCICFSSIESIKMLVIINSVVIIVFMILFCLVLLRKNS